MQQNAANNNVFGGVEASILSYSPFVYNVGADDSSEWVMLYDIDHGYTQLGWIEAIGGWRRTFIEYGNGGPFTDLYYSSTPINSLNDYKLVFDPTTWEYGYYLNGQGLRSIQLFYSPNQVQVYAEIHTSASQMPGGTANYNYADSARVYEPAGPNGHWSYASATTSNTAIFAHVLPQGGTSGVDQYDTYDNNCLY